MACAALLGVLLGADRASAEPSTPRPGAAAEDYPRGLAGEVNVLWPFFPGGINELRLLVPVVRSDRASGRGEAVLGLYSDFASRLVAGQTPARSPPSL